MHLLHHRHARLAFDRFQAERAVGSRAGENNANGLVLLIHGQRAKEIVNRQMRRLFLLSFHPVQCAAQDRQVAARRADIDVVRLDLQPVRSLVHFEVRDLAQQLRQEARVARMLMGDDDEGHTGIVRHAREQYIERL